ncbi:MAG: apolipoprotein N-acyltransferase [Candidatus Sericytochromatia bacterium]|nr:MAG: apolipoprotein N-acyltransferase [Candidatus Sericytochromatia bacterium]
MNKYIISVLSGIFTSLSFNILKLDWIVWFSISPLIFFLIDNEINLKSKLKLSFCYSFSFYLGLLTWLFRLHPLTWVGFTEVESILILILGWVVFSLIEALGLSFIAFFTINKSEIQNIILIPFAWILIEYLQGLTNFGFTWGRLGISQFQNIYLIQSANILGSLWISFLIVFVNTVIAFNFINYKRNKKIHFKSVLILFILVSINFVYGYYSFNKEDYFKNESKATIVQGNILSDQKWDISVQSALDIYLDLSKKSLGRKNKSDFIVWPESAVKTLIENEVIIKQLKDFTKLYNVTLITGCFSSNKTINQILKGEEYEIMNSITGINEKGEILGFYSKRHLVPFGEYLPFRKLLEFFLPKISKLNALEKDLTPGKDAGIFSTKYGNIGGLVCYESIFPEIARDSVLSGANLLVIVTNDSWFKDSMATQHHNAQAVFRAIENNRYIIRAANTGISSFISSKGEILNYLPPLVKDTISYNVRFKDNVSYYTKYGDVIVILSLLVILSSYIKSKVFSHKF